MYIFVQLYVVRASVRKTRVADPDLDKPESESRSDLIENTDPDPTINNMFFISIHIMVKIVEKIQKSGHILYSYTIYKIC